MQNFKQIFRANLSNLIAFILVFMGLFAILGAFFVKEHFGVVDFGSILFHLRFPLLSDETPFLADFLLLVFLPSLILSAFVGFPRQIWSALKFGANLCKTKILPFCKAHATALQIILALAILIRCFDATNNQLEIAKYFKTQQIFSTLYEEHYKAFSTDLRDFKPKQNLIVILAESMESTLSAQNFAQNQNGGGNPAEFSPFGELIPNLTRLALSNTNFSSTSDATHSNIIGGYTQLNGTGWTIAGTISLLCGIPLNMPIGGNDFAHKQFLASAPCVSDVLADLGYWQIFFSGIHEKFAARKAFFETHKVQVMDLPYFQAQNLLPKPLPKALRGEWDMKDSKVFELAKNYLKTAPDTPFALYIGTIDMHISPHFIDQDFCPNLAPSVQNAAFCTDKIIADFIDFVQKSKFGENTTIIILGDHLSMAQNTFPRGTQRFVYNAFINPKFMQKPSLKLTKNRALSHFDIAPLILDSLGIQARAFGLGRNPLYEKTLLEGTFDASEFNTLLNQRNKIYDGFWEVK